MKNIFSKKALPYWLSFFVPFILFAGYFAYHGSNILTIDLGQQYIDFLAFVRRNLFSDPLNLIYSFQNGHGNSMIGTDAYYLLSPLNLLLFLFPLKILPYAIYVLISVKIALSGLTAFHYWNKKFNNTWSSLPASLAYALSGYAMAYFINLMWLDSVILLPILVMEIDKLLAGKKHHLVAVTCALWITNFYSGYMALLFGLIYFIARSTSEGIFLEKLWAYIKSSAIASFMSAVLLIPAASDLLLGKAKNSATWSMNFLFEPWQLFMKLLTGAYNFREMSAGLPNIFLTTLLFYLAIQYFFNKNFSAKEKWINGFVTLFFILSLSWIPLNLIWHMGQFPIWYPSRFSFVVIFWVIDLALKNLNNLDLKMGKVQPVLLIILSIAFVLEWIKLKPSFTFLNMSTILISGIYLFLSVLYCLVVCQDKDIKKSFFAVFVFTEVLVNLYLSLNNLTFQNNRDYEVYATNMREIYSKIQAKDPSFYRTAAVFSRDDDDSFSIGYNGLSTFNSLINNTTSDFVKNFGYAQSLNSYSMAGGNPISDSLFGVKYIIKPTTNIYSIPESERLQISNTAQVPTDKMIAHTRQLMAYVQPAVPMVFSSNTSLKFDLNVFNPVDSINNFAHNVLNNQKPYLMQFGLDNFKLKNAKKDKNSATNYIAKNANKDAYIKKTIKLSDNHSYYLLLSSDIISNNNIDVTVNDVKLTFPTKNGQNILIYMTQQSKGEKLRIKFKFKDSLDISSVQLVNMNVSQYNKDVIKFNTKQPTVSLTNPMTVETTSFKSGKYVKTTIPWSENWTAYVNGKKAQTTQYNNALLAVKTKPGQSIKVKLVFVPKMLYLGLLITLIATAIFWKFKKHIYK
ncbi:MAG: YfhO family protein [Lactobacillus sp.]|nr:YfhO family protein [Lactobacillus sp.]